jgi:poly-gamma-glutamate synthesis protein (capsule biosynthesis protein)
VHVVPALTEKAADELCGQVRQVRQPGDVAVVSVHWGSNWGYQIDSDVTRFAHRLIDGGVDLIHGHSSHHPRPLEVYRQKLILYGCGDLVDDYEGIGGHQQYRSDLRLLYLPRLNAQSGELLALRMAPMQARQMRLHRAADRDARWLQRVLDKVSRRFGSQIDLGPDGLLTLRSPTSFGVR